MDEIYFGPVAKFYEAAEVTVPSAAYRKSAHDTELDFSLVMLKRHLSQYFSGNVGGSSSALAGDSIANLCPEAMLDNFFK